MSIGVRGGFINQDKKQTCNTIATTHNQNNLPTIQIIYKLSKHPTNQSAINNKQQVNQLTIKVTIQLINLQTNQ